MSCTICKRTGCRADVCQSDIIDESHRELVRMLIETVESTSHELSSWPHYRVSQINYSPSSFIYQGEPSDIRRNICSMREAYLSRDIQTDIKKKIRGVVSNWSVGLFKRILPRLRGSFRMNYFDQYNRLLAEPRLVSPKTVTDYRSYILGFAMFILRKRLPENFLNLSDIPDTDLVPAQVVYRERIVCKEIRIHSKVTMKMCGPDEKYMIDDTCPICMDKIQANNVIAYTCGHAFCCDCSTESLKKCGRNCPMCRAKTTHIKFKSDILPEKFNILMKLIR